MQVLTKQPNEAVFFTFNFGAVIDAGDTVASIASMTISNCNVVSGSSLATIGSNAYEGRQAQTKVTGGTAGESYRLTCRVTDSVGQTHELDGIVEVIEL